VQWRRRFPANLPGIGRKLFLRKRQLYFMTWSVAFCAPISYALSDPVKPAISRDKHGLNDVNSIHQQQ
jgi:hypothetical protein